MVYTVIYAVAPWVVTHLATKRTIRLVRILGNCLIHPCRSLPGSINAQLLQRLT